MLRDLIELCLDDKREAGKRPRYLSQLKCSSMAFARYDPGEGPHSEKLAHDISQSEVKLWLRSRNWKPKTRNVYMTDLRTVFQWGIEEGYLKLNPCHGIKKAVLEDAEVTLLSPTETARLLLRCLHPRKNGEIHTSLLPYVVLGIFCGLRPERELGRLTLGDLNMDEHTVIVQAAHSKTRGRRVVDISANAMAWLRLGLEALHDEAGTNPDISIIPPNFDRRWKRLRRDAGFEIREPKKGAAERPWRHDVMRHTFASMHYAAHQNEHLLKAQLGHHQSSDMLFQHYRAVQSRKVAGKFWTLLPPKEEV